MLNTAPVFLHLKLGTCASEVVQNIAALIDNSKTPMQKAVSLIKDIIGVDAAFEDVRKARLVAMLVGEKAVRSAYMIDDEDIFLRECDEAIDKRLTDPKNAWMYVAANPLMAPVEKVQVVADIDVKVEVKANGKIKKGGKQVLAAELYKKRVLEAKTPATNQEFIACLVKELGMSKAGATTYAYNCKKQLGEPAGGIVKAKKGRKAKVAAAPKKS